MAIYDTEEDINRALGRALKREPDLRVWVYLVEDRLAANLFSYRQLSSLSDALEDYDTRLFFSKIPMFVIMILISVVILIHFCSHISR